MRVPFYIEYEGNKENKNRIHFLLYNLHYNSHTGGGGRKKEDRQVEKEASNAFQLL